MGTGIAEIITLPICTTKTRFQTNLEYKSINSVVKDIYKSEGLRGFYRSSFPAILSQILSTSFKYTVYQSLKKYNDSNTFTANAINGLFGAFLTSLITHPIDVIKVNQQMNTFVPKRYIQGGISAWYKGYSKTITKNAFGAVLYLPLYDKINFHLKNPFFSSFYTSIIATIILHPIDLFKVRHVGNQKNIYMINESVQQQNAKSNPYFKRVFRGLNLNLLRVVPHFTIAMTIAEEIRKR